LSGTNTASPGITLFALVTQSIQRAISGRTCHRKRSDRQEARRFTLAFPYGIAEKVGRKGTRGVPKSFVYEFFIYVAQLTVYIDIFGEREGKSHVVIVGGTDDL
jgi:hypothetical protein